jgi:hypothetical protein
LRREYRKGTDDEAQTPESGLDPRGKAAMAGRVLILQGVKVVFKWVNGNINGREFKEACAKIEPAVTATLSDDPSLGALICGGSPPQTSY